MLDENWTPCDQYPAPLYFHCPSTMCDGHVKLKNRSRRHAVRCEKCGLDFSIGPDSRVAAIGDTLLNSVKYATIVLFGVAIGMVLGRAVPW